MSYELYKVIHVFGVVAAFMAIGGLLIRGIAGSSDERSRKLAGMTHGIALILVLISGFGLLSRIGMGHAPGGLPLWVWLKLIIWLLVGASIVVIRKMPGLRKLMWWLMPFVAVAAAWVALTKPI